MVSSPRSTSSRPASAFSAGGGAAPPRTMETRMAWSADEITTQILEWAMSVLPETPGNAPALNSNLRKSGIDLRLVRVTPRPSPKGATAPFVLDLEYLLTLQMHDAASEQHALSELMFAALANRSFEVEGGREVERVCQMLGMPVAPGFILRAPLARQQRRATPTKTIEQLRLDRSAATPSRLDQPRPPRPERTRPAPTPGPAFEPLGPEPERAPAREPILPGFHSLAGGRIEGRIIGPRDEAIEGASVEAVGAQGGKVWTDEKGRFRIEDAGAEGAAVKLLVGAGGAEFEATAVAGLPLTVRLPLAE